MAVKADKTPGRVAYINARLLDPATDLDSTGGLLSEGEVIKDVGPHVTADVALGRCDSHRLRRAMPGTWPGRYARAFGRARRRT